MLTNFFLFNIKLLNYTFVHIHLEVNLEPVLKTSPVPLSNSVGITIPKQGQSLPRPIEIVHDLELEFKGRYKSDYFSQEGTVRKPRYVADRDGNHCVTLKVSLNSLSTFIINIFKTFISQVQPRRRGYVRIDWTTIQEQGIRYSMPYKFQINNTELMPDVNPMMAYFEADDKGIVQLYLVLIKLKQDELKSVQPLQLFPPWQYMDNFQSKSSSKQCSPLNGKELIRKYQLSKSQLAFTLCNVSPDGTSFVEDWNTTVYSTVMTGK